MQLVNEEYDTSETTPLTKSENAVSTAVMPPDSTKPLHDATTSASAAAAASADSPNSELSDGLSDDDDDVDGTRVRLLLSSFVYLIQYFLIYDMPASFLQM